MTSPVWFLWWGGESYSVGHFFPDDVEQAESVAAVVSECESRYFNRDGRTPAVSEESSAHVFYAAPDTYNGDPYPDVIVELTGGEWTVSPC